ncbi:MAG: sugar phosphate nucleotidyltransferase [Thermoleophilia bacterium]
MAELVGLIPAAGKGTRAYPYTRRIPKGMLKVSGIPLLEHLIILQRDQLGIRRIYIVVGAMSDVIEEYFQDGSRWGVEIEYLHNDAVHLGLAYSVSLGAKVISDPFVLMLSDEYYQDTDHFRLKELTLDGALGYCGLVQTPDWDRIRRNYTVRLQAGRVSRIVEKPRERFGDLLGTGTFLLSPRVFGYLDAALAADGESTDFIGVLDAALQGGEELRPFQLSGQYVNVNDVDSLNWANYLLRSQQLPTASVSVVIQSVGVEEGLPRLTAEFDALSRVSEVLVTVPAGIDEPDWLAALSKTRWLQAPAGVSEYGSIIAYGLDQSQGDILVVVEGFYSFYPADLPKLLAYLADADLVLGTRTTRQLIQQGSRMRGRVRLTHMFLAKLIELLWIGHRIRLTDVGCTYRALWRQSYLDIRSRLKSSGPEYVLEMDIETLRSRKRLIEVPVSFLNTNEVLAEKYQHIGVFFGMLRTIISKRLSDS